MQPDVNDPARMADIDRLVKQVCQTFGINLHNAAAYPKSYVPRIWEAVVNRWPKDRGTYKPEVSRL